MVAACGSRRGGNVPALATSCLGLLTASALWLPGDAGTPLFPSAQVAVVAVVAVDAGTPRERLTPEQSASTEVGSAVDSHAGDATQGRVPALDSSPLAAPKLPPLSIARPSSPWQKPLLIAGLLLVIIAISMGRRQRPKEHS